VVIDFSSHDATPASPALRGTKRRWSSAPPAIPRPKIKIAKAQSPKIPIVWASNFSTGVNTLFWLTRKAAEILGPDFDLEVVEMHHRLKKDAPSGTAKTLAEILAASANSSLTRSRGTAAQGHRRRAHGRRNRHPFALRGGDVVGDHTVIFANNGRAAGTHAQGLQPRHVRQRRPPRRAMGRETKARPLRHAGRAGVEMNVAEDARYSSMT
jgi:4-hydroxy-tetrahydrodipicolinate reductase